MYAPSPTPGRRRSTSRGAGAAPCPGRRPAAMLYRTTSQQVAHCRIGYMQDSGVEQLCHIMSRPLRDRRGAESAETRGDED